MSNQAQAKVVSRFPQGLSHLPALPPGILRSKAHSRRQQKLLPHIASLKVDIIYLCPTMVSDDGRITQFWSDRQNASSLETKNPYRIKDYYNTDPEYGTNNDLRQFVDTAHRLGMLVILDLVYFHCGYARSSSKAILISSSATRWFRQKRSWHFPRNSISHPRT